MILRLPILGSEMHIKPRRQIRYVEDKRQVPTLFIGGMCLSYWPRWAVERERKFTW